MHVTYVSLDSISEGVGKSQILPLLRILRSEGIEVRLISFEKNSISESLMNEIHSLGIDWFCNTFRPGYFVPSILRIIQISRQIKPTDVVHARSDIACIAALIFRKYPILWDIRGLWGEQRIIIEKSYIKKLVFRFLILFRKTMLRRVQAITTLSHELDKQLIQKYGYLPQLRAVISTFVDINHFRIKRKPPTKLNVLFSGTYNDYYDLDFTRELMGKLKEKVEVEITWLRPLEGTRQSLGLGEKIIQDVKYGEMPDRINDHSIGIAICKEDNWSNVGAMPTKIAEFLACGKPIIINRNLGDYGKLIKEYNAGIVLEDRDWDKIIRQVLAISNDEKIQTNCRKLAQDHFDLQKGASKYLSIYREILNMNKSK